MLTIFPPSSAFFRAFRLVRGLASLVFILFLLQPAAAKHIIGGEITYKYLGPGTAGNTKRFEFTMKIYRDCNGGGPSFDVPAYMAIYQGTEGNNSLYEKFNLYNPKTRLLVPDTPRCIANVPAVCVEEGVYVFTRDLPVLTSGSYFVVYQRCCRNVTITNINNPEDVGATFTVELTAAGMAENNTSPSFNNFPPIIICKNVPLIFDHSITDEDGDFVTYSFCSPLAGGGPLGGGNFSGCMGVQPNPPCGPPFSNVPFTVPTYTPSVPMGGNPVVKINTVTGLITGTPNIIGQFVVGVCVQEFRNGQLLSTIRRDFQFNVADCTPTLLAQIETDSVTAKAEYIVTSCGDRTITFENKSIQAQYINSFRWEFDLNNGFRIADSTTWNLTLTFPDTGLFKGLLILNPKTFCGDTAKINVRILPDINADFSFKYDTCKAGPVTFTDLSKGDGIINKWSWDFGFPNSKSTVRHPVYRFEIPGEHPVRLRVTDRNQCWDQITKPVRYFPAPPIIPIRPSVTEECVPANILFRNFSKPIDSTYKFEWTFGDGTDTTGVISPRHIYTQPGIYDVSLRITSPIGCVAADTFYNLVEVAPAPVADFSYSPSENITILNPTISFTDLSTGAYRWQWRFDRFGLAFDQNPVFTFPDTGRMAVRLLVVHPYGCRDSITRILNIEPEIRWFMPNAFTPNGDGANDGFKGKGYMYGVTNFKMAIWNRWGEKVFETADPADAWNGRAQNSGDMSPAGVYVYVVTFRGPRGEPYEYTGYATLVR